MVSQVIVGWHLERKSEAKFALDILIVQSHQGVAREPWSCRVVGDGDEARNRGRKERIEPERASLLSYMLCLLKTNKNF